MADTFSDARLEEILMSVGAHLEIGAASAPSVHRGSTWLRRVAVAAVILVALLRRRPHRRAGAQRGRGLARHRQHARGRGPQRSRLDGAAVAPGPPHSRFS